MSASLSVPSFAASPTADATDVNGSCVTAMAVCVRDDITRLFALRGSTGLGMADLASLLRVQSRLLIEKSFLCIFVPLRPTALVDL